MHHNQLEQRDVMLLFLRGPKPIFGLRVIKQAMHCCRHETSIDGGGEQAHRPLKQRGSPPLESRGSKHPPQARRPQPLRPPSRRAGPRAVAAPSPAFSSRKVIKSLISTWVHACIRRPDRCALHRMLAVAPARGGSVRCACARARVPRIARRWRRR
jgi:hypothetical protein